MSGEAERRAPRLRSAPRSMTGVPLPYDDDGTPVIAATAGAISVR
jgi:hypothetical protein